MEALKYTSLSAGQLHVLEMLNRCKTPESLKALKKVLCDFYANEAQKEMDRLWDAGMVNEQTIEDWGKEHMRTTYNHA